MSGLITSAYFGRMMNPAKGVNSQELEEAYGAVRLRWVGEGELGYVAKRL